MSRAAIMIAAGGTGGHLFPAFALTQELKRRGHEVDLVTDVRADQYGIDFPGRGVHQVPSATLRGRSPQAVVKLGLILLKGIWRASTLLKEINPRVIVGFGGYPTVPPLLAAKFVGVPVVIHEANAVMGRANRLLARVASSIALTFDKTKYLKNSDQSKKHIVGMPVRDAVLEEVKPYPKRAKGGAFSMLIFGGSQGARVFADIVPAALKQLPPEYRKRLTLVQQVREEDMTRVRDAYSEAGIDAELAEFFPDLPKRMANAHLVIGRSGASTVAELTVLGRPAILVPLPHALDNDQLENATRLQEAGGAWCIEQADFTTKRLCREIMHLADQPDVMVGAAKAALGLGEPKAVARLADVIEELVR